MRLLVVEDDRDLNRQLVSALEDAGYAVDKAFDGEEGHFLGETEPYDGVILDMGLPKMDGIRVLEKWRRDGDKESGDTQKFAACLRNAHPPISLSEPCRRLIWLVAPFSHVLRFTFHDFSHRLRPFVLVIIIGDEP